MGRVIIADERISKQIESFYKEDKWQVGLVIGNLSAQRSHAVHLARTPNQEDEDASTDAAENRPSGQSNKTKTTTQKLENVDERWVANHAKQVIRMLPGGLDVVGVFAVAPPDGMKSAQAKLRQLVFAVHKALSKLSVAEPGLNKINDRVVLQICSVSRKLTCRTFDVTDHKCSASPADWKSQNVLDKLVCLSSQMVLDETIVISEEGLGHTLHKQVLTGLNSVIHEISLAKSTVNGRFIDENDMLCKEEKSSGKKKSAKSGRESALSQEYRIALLVQNCATEFAEASSLECGAKMLLRGTIKSKAYVSQKSTIAEATAAIKSDIIRSLISRCILLCEDVETTEEEHDPKILYETPRRITAKVPCSHLQVCDYMFPEETLADAMCRFVELLDLPVANDDINLDFESLPNDEELEKPKDVDIEDDVKENGVEQSANNETTLNNIHYIIGGIIVALLAILVYLLLNQN